MSSALDQFERQLVAASRELSRPRPASAPATTTTENGRGPTDRGRRRRRFPRERLLVALAALIVVGGGVAAANSILFPSQRLAEGTVNCFMATHGTGALDGKTLAVADAKPNGQPPIGYCRMWYRVNHYRLNGSQTGPIVAALPLIACQENATTVGVYVATGKPNQCQTLGEKPLPKTYASAGARLRDLQQALFAIQDKRDCASVTSIAQQTRAVLASEGFTHWRVVTPPPNPGKHWLFGYPLPAGTGGTCGKLTGNPTSAIDIDTQRQTVTVSVGPPRTIALRSIASWTSLPTRLAAGVTRPPRSDRSPSTPSPTRRCAPASPPSPDLQASPTSHHSPSGSTTRDASAQYSPYPETTTGSSTSCSTRATRPACPQATSIRQRVLSIPDHKTGAQREIAANWVAL